MVFGIIHSIIGMYRQYSRLRGIPVFRPWALEDLGLEGDAMIRPPLAQRISNRLKFEIPWTRFNKSPTASAVFSSKPTAGILWSLPGEKVCFWSTSKDGVISISSPD